jgi:hypothetical protein
LIFISCFPHVINLAVKIGLKHLTEVSFFGDPELMDLDLDFTFDEELPPEELELDLDYLESLRSDVVSRVRRYVTACRASGQRREEFEQIIKEGNESGGWGPEPKQQLRVVGLLKDVDTRWSSIFKMVDRFLEMYPVCHSAGRNSFANLGFFLGM